MNRDPLNAQPAEGPAYRQPYFWMVVLFPAVAVIAGVITLALALRSEDGLVTDDYYRRGLEINRDLRRDDVATAHGLHADLQADPLANTLTVTLRAEPGFGYPESIKMLISHPTRAGLDANLTLSRSDRQRYVAALPSLPAGHWYIQIEAADWRLLQSWSLPAAAAQADSKH